MTTTRSWGLFVLASLFLAMLSSAGSAAEPEKPDSKPEAAALDQAKLDKEFEEMLSNSQLVGKFSISGEKGAKEGGEDKYTIRKVSKLKNGFWLIESRIQYGKYDLTVPLMLKVLWAGDTPMISLTDLTIPGMGTFTSRVMFHRGQYAGTWQHGEVGGHMWGRVVKLPDADEEAQESSKADGEDQPKSKDKEPAAKPAPPKKPAD